MRSARRERASGLAQRAAWLNRRSTQTTRVSALPASRGLTRIDTDHRSAADLESALARRRAWIGDLPRGSDTSTGTPVAVTSPEGAGPPTDSPPSTNRIDASQDGAQAGGTEGAAAPDASDVRDWDGQAQRQTAPSPAQRRTEAMVRDALTARGIRYRWGGTSRGGFDCSGFTRYLMARNLGIQLPHSAHAQAHYGQKVSIDELREGDLVFFRTYGRGISHVGVYIGDNLFIHAPRTGRSVAVEPLTGYYRRRFVTARRLSGTGPPG
jgi:cell wall-associated NlpC family hydrolase